MSIKIRETDHAYPHCVKYVAKENASDS